MERRALVGICMFNAAAMGLFAARGSWPLLVIVGVFTFGLSIVAGDDNAW